jgi:GT2 family glycosyltransferase
VDKIKNKFPKVKLIELYENIGFGKANNMAIFAAYHNGAQHVLLLNQDASISCDNLVELVQIQKRYSGFFVLSPLHLGSPGLLDYWFTKNISASDSMISILSDCFIRKKAQRIYEVSFVNAAIWLVSRKCIETIGLFNPIFMHYGEDINYTDRISSHGGKIGIVPNLLAKHPRKQVTASKFKNNFIDALKIKGIILSRLSRANQPLGFNMFSAASFILFFQFDERLSFVRQAAIRCKLLLFVMINLRQILRNNKESRKGKFSFFDSACKDCKKHIHHSNVSIHGLNLKLDP